MDPFHSRDRISDASCKNGRGYKCSFCNNEYTNRTNLEAHIRNHTGEHPFKCTKCQKQFRSATILSTHMKMHLGEAGKIHHCPYCSMNFHYRGTLKNHLRCHTGEKPFSCKICGKRYRWSNDLRQHERGHSGDFRHRCIKCSYKTVRSSHLRRHLAIHEKREYVKCSLCSSRVMGKDSLKHHMKYMHPIGGKPIHNYGCIFCGKLFQLKSNFHSHLLVHIKEKPWPCDLCGGEFSTSSTKYAHIRSRHTGEKTFMCRFCRDDFGSEASLRCHLQQKHAELLGALKCDKCAKMFVSSRKLNDHKRRLHPNCYSDFPFGCVFCPKRFYAKDEMHKHIIRHINERPYFCELCGREYSSPNGKQDHITTKHSKGKTFSSDICGSCCLLKSRLRAHLKRHGIQYTPNQDLNKPD